MSEPTQPAIAAPAAPVESATTQPDTTQPVKETPELSVSQSPAPEKTVPYSRFSEVNKQFREVQRKLAEREAKDRMVGYEGEDVEKLMGHPFVQDLLLKQAKRELTDYAKDVLDQYPNIPSAVKKAILANVRGFVKEATTDVETAKLDLQEYIESIVEETPAATTPQTLKDFPVVGTTAATSPKGSTPADVQKIFEKPVDEWTEEDQKTLDNFKKTTSK